MTLRIPARRATAGDARRVLLADDHAVVRHGLRIVLDAQPDLEVVAEAATARRRSSAACADDVDLAILDVSMPRMTGLQAARELTRRAPELRRPDALDARQRAVPLRGAPGRRVRLRAQDRRRPRPRRGVPRDDARRAVPLPRRGRGARARAIARAAAATARRPRDPLTPREDEVSSSSPRRTPTTRSPRLLLISQKTVERHRANILEKLGMRDRVELTRYAIRRGLVRL